MIEYLTDLSTRCLRGFLLILGMVALCSGLAILLAKLGRFIYHVWGVVL